MKVTSVDIQPIGDGHAATALLLLGTDESLVGIGELAVDRGTSNARAAQDLSTMLVGRDPFDTQALAVEYVGRGGGSPDVAALAAASTAMADLCGQYLGVPAHQLLGGRVRDRVRVCAIGWANGASDLGQREAAARRTVDAGFDALSVEPIASPAALRASRPYVVAESIGALRQALPDDVDLVVAAGRGLSRDQARAAGDRIAAYEPLWLECRFEDSWPSRAEGEPPFAVPLASSASTPATALGALLSAGQLDHIVLDVGLVGGLREARRIAALAEVYHVGIVPLGSTPVSLAMALHLAAVIPNLTMVQMPPGMAPVRDGLVDVDLSPGLGVDAGRATTLEVA